jgi:Domain of unknown function (DUF6285)
VTRLTPDARNLLATALDALRAEILPVIPPEKRYAALMIANALAMTEREISASCQEGHALAAMLYDDPQMTAEECERRLASDIEAGHFDAPGARREAAFRAINAINAGRLAITNPQLLPKPPA